MGMNIPGPGGQVDRLNGLKEGQWQFNRDAVDCEVLAAHPLLGSLKPGDIVGLEPNGEGGILSDGMIGLIRVSNADDLTTLTSTAVPSTYGFYPLAIGNLGKGKIVSYAFTAWKPMPDDLQNATGGRFLGRCVRWLSGRPLD